MLPKLHTVWQICLYAGNYLGPHDIFSLKFFAIGLESGTCRTAKWDMFELGKYLNQVFAYCIKYADYETKLYCIWWKGDRILWRWRGQRRNTREGSLKACKINGGKKLVISVKLTRVSKVSWPFLFLPLMEILNWTIGEMEEKEKYST